MERARRTLWPLALFLVAALVSGALYARSRSADFDRHARAVEAIGTTRSLGARLTEELLAARFGLSNQYDPVTATDLALTTSLRDLRETLGGVVPIDPELDAALTELGRSGERQHHTVERFKGENSILRNSLYFLPTAADEAIARLPPGGATNAELSPAVSQVVRSALIYDLIGDESSGAAYERAFSELERRRADAPDEAKEALTTLLAHARVVGQKGRSVDGFVKRAIGSDLADRVRDVEDLYHDRFGALVARSNLYRKVLYAWSLGLLGALGLFGFQLRRIYADLERRVRVRTAELRAALDALWGEMQLARRIQEAIVPAAPTLADCDVAVSMKPAAEVGGDYYDVVQAGSFEWILIGDVSGHGVPAGLVMMMCQTAVRSVLAVDPSIGPGRLLARVNFVLTRNIRQLGEDKYMTISALRRDADGRVVVAGAHQDLLVYRAREDAVESMEVEGMWLGLVDDIGDAQPTREFDLHPDDVLVLYSDGITEARRDDLMFEPDGIRQVLSAARGKTATELLADLDRALVGYELADDATVLIIRRLGGAA